MIIVHVHHRTLNLFFSWRSFQDDDIECAKICDAGVGRVVFLIFLLKRIGFLCSRSPSRRRCPDDSEL